jgi:hypothetical protein
MSTLLTIAATVQATQARRHYVADVLACAGILNGETDSALVAGVNAMLSSQTTVKISQLQVCGIQSAGGNPEAVDDSCACRLHCMLRTVHGALVTIQLRCGPCRLMRTA